MKKSFACAAAASLILAGCSVSTHYFQSGGAARPALPASVVKLYAGIPADLSYDVLGNVAVDATGDSAAAARLLRERAASIGADAVIRVELTKMNTFVQRTGLNGVAVKLK